MLALAALAPIAAPYVALAATAPLNLQTNVFKPTILAGPLTLCVGSSAANTSGGANLPTCNNLCDLVAQIAQIIYYMIAVVIWVVTPILVTVGGLMILLGGASPEMVGRGKKTITGAVWGVVIVLVAWVIVYTFISAFGNLGKFVGGFGGSGQCLVSSAPAATTTATP